MKDKSGILAVLAMAIASLDPKRELYHNGSTRKVSLRDIDVNPPKKVIPKGCKEYTFNESWGILTVIASNEKVALRKYNKWCSENIETTK